MRGRPLPTGGRAARAVGFFLLLLVISNLSATVFWNVTGGVGLLDLDGGANLFRSEAGVPLPAEGTPDRSRAIVAAYEPAERLIHAVVLGTMDLVFPAAGAWMGWTTIGWSAAAWQGAFRRGVLVAAGSVSLAYLLADWSENLLELAVLSGRRGAFLELLPTAAAAKLGSFAVMAVGMFSAVMLRVGWQRSRVDRRGVTDDDGRAPSAGDGRAAGRRS